MSGALRQFTARPTGVTLEDAILALSPAGYWKLDEGSGTTAADSSGNNRDGTYSGTYTLQGQDGYLLLGGAGYVDIPDNDAWTWMTAEGLSVFALCYPTVAATGRRFIVSKGASSNFEWTLNINDNAQISASQWDLNGAVQRNEQLNDVVTTLEWQAYAYAAYHDPAWGGSVNGQRFQLYRDTDTPLATTSATPTTRSVAAGTAPVHIGGRADNPANSRFQGAIAHLAIFPGELTDANVGTLMDAATTDGWI